MGKRGGLVVDTDKAGNSLGSADGNPRVIGDFHLNKDVARKGFFLGFDFFATTDDHLTLNRDDSLKYFIGKTHGFNTGDKGVYDFVFVPGVGVDNVPGGVNAGGLIG